MAGLFDASQLCGNAQALEMDNKMASYFKKRIDKLSDAQMQNVMKTEFGGMMEVLANLSGVTGNADQLALAKRFDHKAVFNPLAAHQDKLARIHANTQIPKMTGAARIYELTGDARYHTVAEYFWSEVTGHHSFVTGGNSFNEHFNKADIEATDLSPDTSETCNTYNMLKLTRHLIGWEPTGANGDYYERALFNHILGSIDPDTGMTMYYYSLKPGHFKVYSSPTDSFWCCTGTGTENHAEYGNAIYFHNDDTLWVNQFIASELNWREKGIVLRQETSFPQEQGSTLVVQTEKPVKLALKVRVPAWAHGATVMVNGAAVDVGAAVDGYVTIDRQWVAGDKVTISLPMALELHRASDDPASVAILYGPVVLAGELGRKGMPASDEAKDQKDYDRVPTPRAPVLVSDDANPVNWLKPVAGKPLTFTTMGVARPGNVELIPIYQLHHERYTVYWRLLSSAQWPAEEQTWKEQDARLANLTTQSSR